MISFNFKNPIIIHFNFNYLYCILYLLNTIETTKSEANSIIIYSKTYYMNLNRFKILRWKDIKMITISEYNLSLETKVTGFDKYFRDKIIKLLLFTSHHFKESSVISICQNFHITQNLIIFNFH